MLVLETFLFFRLEILSKKYNLIVQSQKDAEKLLGLMSKKITEISHLSKIKQDQSEKNESKKKNKKNVADTPVYLEISSPIKEMKNRTPTSNEESTFSYSNDFEDEFQYSQLESESEIDKF